MDGYSAKEGLTSVLSPAVPCEEHISGKTPIIQSPLSKLQQLKTFSLYLFILELFKEQGSVPTIMHTYPDLTDLRTMCSPQIETCPALIQRLVLRDVFVLFVFQRRRNEVKTTNNVRKLIKAFSQF